METKLDNKNIMELRKIEIVKPNEVSWKPTITLRGFIIAISIVVIGIVAYLIIRSY